MRVGVWKCVNIMAVEVKAWQKCRCRVVCKRAYTHIFFFCDTAPIYLVLLLNILSP